MKKFVFLTFLFVLLTACNVNTDAGLKPPSPVISVNGQEISYETGSYSWENGGHAVIADAAAPSQMDLTINTIHPNDEMTIKFDYEPKMVQAGIWESEGNQMQNNVWKLPAEDGTYIYVIHAKWPEGDAIYAMKFNVPPKEVSLFKRVKGVAQR